MDRLLFVDDEPFVLKALKRTFELEGYEVVTATRPAEALDILDAGHFTWEDAASEYGALVTTWWGGGYATTGPAAAG